MKDIKDVFIFLGFSFKRFLVYLFYNFLYLLLVLVIIFSVFLCDFQLLTHIMNIVLFLLAVILIHWVMKNTFLLKQKWLFHLSFLRFLKNNRDNSFRDHPEKSSELNANSKKVQLHMKGIKLDLKKSGLHLISKDLVLAVAVTVSGHAMGHLLDLNRDFQVKWQHDLIKYHFFRAMVFVFLLMPFSILSFLFTMGIPPGLKFLVYAIGFLFAYFLHAAIVEPIFSLFILKKIYESYKD